MHKKTTVHRNNRHKPTNHHKNLTDDITLDAALRHVSSLPNPAVAHYEELNARLGWRASKTWDLDLSGLNLLHAHHREFTVPPSDDIGRSASIEAPMRF